ncbi:hypothetical protein QN277_024000 [Acacia crassicarpa]|uniref:Uncharacterized protein n=1 Tax=Acacia crassicarpa TaxID=499986 RepID=A0AAE1K6W6_9FABA|nr:hypothetical protein QN277_024000 [Acacia crassicarpa]
MAHYPEDGDDDQKKKTTSPSTVWRWHKPRHGFALRRRRVKTQRLGGKKPRQRMAAALVGMFRKMKVKLKECYRNVVKDMAEAGAGVEMFHQRLLMETSLAVPIGITFSSGTLYPSRFGLDHHRQPQKLYM